MFPRSPQYSSYDVDVYFTQDSPPGVLCVTGIVVCLHRCLTLPVHTDTQAWLMCS